MGEAGEREQAFEACAAVPVARGTERGARPFVGLARNAPFAGAGTPVLQVCSGRVTWPVASVTLVRTCLETRGHRTKEQHLAGGVTD